MLSHLQSGKYEVIQELAQGGMGKIYLATHTTLNRQVAIKALHAQYSGDDAFIERFLREARAMAQLDHPNIISVHDVFQDDGNFYIVMEFCAGKSLDARIKQGAISVKDALSVTLQVARGLHYAHQQGIVHRDIKPANIMVENDGRVKLTDFGIAAAKNLSGLTATGQVIGSPQYMSPEQAAGGELDGRSDLYSLGMVLYKMLTGKTPLEGQSLISIMGKLVYQAEDLEFTYPGHIPKEVIALVEELVQRDPDKRIANAQALIGRIVQIMEGLNKSPAREEDEEATEFISIDEHDISGVFENQQADDATRIDTSRAIAAKTSATGKLRRPLLLAVPALVLVAAVIGALLSGQEEASPPLPAKPVAQATTKATPPSALKALIESVISLNNQTGIQQERAKELVKDQLLAPQLQSSIELKQQAMENYQQSLQQMEQGDYDSAMRSAQDAQRGLQQAGIRFTELVNTANLKSDFSKLLAESDAVEELYRSVASSQRKARDNKADTYAKQRFKEAGKLEQKGREKLDGAQHAIRSGEYNKATTLLAEARTLADRAVSSFQDADELAQRNYQTAKLKDLDKKLSSLASQTRQARSAADKAKAQTLAGAQYTEATQNQSRASAKRAAAQELAQSGDARRATQVYEDAATLFETARKNFILAQQTAIQSAKAEAVPVAQETVAKKLEAFHEAYINKDIAKLDRLTSMSPGRRDLLLQIFKQYDEIHLRIDNVSENRDSAQAVVIIERLTDGAGNQVELAEAVRKTRLTMEKQNGRWGKIKW